MGFIWTGLDESSDRLQRKAFVVAGYLARQESWTDIERYWLRRLEQESNPRPMKYFSSSECMYLSGEFRRFRDPIKYPKPSGRIAADAIRDDLQQILRTSSAMGFALAIRLKDYRSVRKSSRARKALLSNPYEFAYLMTMIVFAGECDDQIPGRIDTETIAFLCDDHNRSANVKAVYDKLLDNNPRCARWMGSLTYMDNKKSPAIQAGDLLAGRCKELVIECLDDTNTATKVARFKSILGRNVGVRCMDKKSLQAVVDANVLRKGRPGIYSTRQLSFTDLIRRDKQDGQK